MPDMMELWHRLPSPPSWRTGEKRAFASLGRALQAGDAERRDAARNVCLARDNTALTAAACVLLDLAGQGWGVSVDECDDVTVSPPVGATNPLEEKLRVRTQELIKR